MSQYSPAKSPSKSSAGVVWFSQALRNFITPYGLAKAAPQPTEMIARLKPFTSEWLVRPNIAISEYAETISANLPFLRENAEDILKSEYIEMLENHFAPMMSSLDALNKKTPSTPTVTEAKDIVKSLVTDNNVDSAMEDLFKVSAALFAISANYIMATSVLRHPKQFAQAIDGTKGKESAEFKRTGSASAMKDYLLHSYEEGDGASTSGILTRKAPKSVAKAFLDSDCSSSSSSSDDESDSDESPTSRRKLKSKKNQKPRKSHEKATPTSPPAKTLEKKRGKASQAPSPQLERPAEKQGKKKKAKLQEERASSPPEKKIKKKRAKAHVVDEPTEKSKKRSKKE
jgi:hypothetical protein